MENSENHMKIIMTTYVKLEGTPWDAEEIYYPLNMSPVLLIFVPRMKFPPLIKYVCHQSCLVRHQPCLLKLRPHLTYHWESDENQMKINMITTSS